MSIPFHPLANIFPLMEGKELEDLAASIKESGQRLPIVMFEGSILDGRNRYRACEMVAVAPMFEQFKSTDPVRFVYDMNVPRRHLEPGQRALIAARLAQLGQGRPEKTGTGSGFSVPTQAEAAEMYKVSDRSVRFAKVALEGGTQEEIKAIEAGKLSPKAAARQVRGRMSIDEITERRAAVVAQGGNLSRRDETRRIKTEVYEHVREALVHLTSLPLPRDAVRIVRTMDRAGVVDSRLIQAIEWLEAFADAWTSREAEDESREQAKRTGNSHAESGKGDRAARAQQPEPAAE